MSSKSDSKGSKVGLSMLFDGIKKVDSFVGDNFSKPLLYGFILIAVAFFFSMNVRLESARLNVAEDWAEDTMYNQMMGQVEMQLAQDPEFSALPPEMQQQRIESELMNMVDDMGDQFNEQVEMQADMIRQHFQNEHGTTYLLGIDPYHFLRRTENFYNHGSIGDEVINGTDYDIYMHGGVGSERSKYGDLLEPIGALFHRINLFFNADADIMHSVSLVPPVIFSLSVIFAFFIIFMFTKSYLASFFTSLFLGITPGIVHATSAGFFDTGFFEIFFPMLTLFLVLKMFREKNTYKKLGWVIVTSFSFLLFRIAWEWWYTFVIFQGVLAIYVAYLILEYILLTKKDVKLIHDKKIIKKNFKNTILTIFFFFTFTFLIIGTYDNNYSLLDFTGLDRVLDRVEISDPTRGGRLWPNVYTTVAELNPGNIGQAIDSLGGEIFFGLSLFGILALFFDAFKNKDSSKLIVGLFLSSLVAGGIYTLLEGTRFIRLLLPYLVLSLGFAFYYIKELLTHFVNEYNPEWFNKNHKKLAVYLPMIIFLFLAVIPMHSEAMVQARQNVPQMSDGWYNSLEYIRDNTDENAILMSWWDFGHWFKGVARRAVVFDGASQNSPVAHWVGRALLSDHNESYGINRMLACGTRNSAFDTLYDELDEDFFEAMDVLENLIMMNKSEARSYLEDNFSSEFTEKMLDETHCKDREMYVIASEDMIGKSGVWGHFGSWNFTRSHIWNSYNSNRRNIDSFIQSVTSVTDIDDQEAVDIYNELSMMTNDQAQEWISPWPSFMGPESSCQKSGNMLQCQEGLEINLENKSESIISVQGGVMQPHSIFYYDYDKEEFNEVIIDEDSDFSVSLINDSDSYSAVIGNKEVIGGLFDKLFFHSHLEEIGNYELFNEDRSIVGGRIYYWKVTWN